MNTFLQILVFMKTIQDELRHDYYVHQFAIGRAHSLLRPTM